MQITISLLIAALITVLWMTCTGNGPKGALTEAAEKTQRERERIESMMFPQP